MSSTGIELARSTNFSYKVYYYIIWIAEVRYWLQYRRNWGKP